MSTKRWWTFILAICALGFSLRVVLVNIDSAQQSNYLNDAYIYYFEAYANADGHLSTAYQCLLMLPRSEQPPLIHQIMTTGQGPEMSQSLINQITASLNIPKSQICNTRFSQFPPVTSLIYSIPILLGFNSISDILDFVALLGALTILITALAGRKAFGNLVGLISAILVAVSPLFFSFDLRTMSEPVVQLNFAFLILSVVSFVKRQTYISAIFIGICMGLVLLTRGESILPDVALILILMVATWKHRKDALLNGISKLGVILVSFAISLSPWLIATYSQFGTPIISTDGGSALADSNSIRTFYGDSTGGWIAFSTSNVQLAKSKNYDNEISQYDQKQALSFLSHHLSRWPSVVAVRFGREYFVSYTSSQVGFLHGFDNWPYWIIYSYAGFLWIMTILGIYGFMLLWRARERQLASILMLPIVASNSVLVMIYATPRILAGSFVALTLLASFGIKELFTKLSQHRNVENSTI
ncbi:MAG: hypothetical protein HKL80_00090 [Acidimicrobiales bacterium]|nr:hypothetical protein [Acidimicrobiales bacterium]